MIQNLNKLTDPQAFITFYYNELKDQLDSNDLSISKVGAFGYMLHILGNLQYDIKKYYDGLFKEAFPISAFNDINLQQHSLTYGYGYSNAVPAVLSGNIIFDFLNLPSRSVNTVRREIELIDITFDLGPLHFILFSNYKIIIDTINFTDFYKVKITDQYGEQKVISISEQNPVVEINGCKQISSETTFFNIPSYPFNSFYTIEIDLLDGTEFLSSIELSVKEYDALSFSSFEPVQSKTFYTQTDAVIFYKIIYRNSLPVLLLELGSGKKGKYIPNSEIQVTLNKTKGVLGNIGKTIFDQKINGYLQISDYDSNGQLIYTISNTLAPEDFIQFDILEGKNGQNTLTGDDLRKTLIEYIQTRDNLINELDYQNILKKYFKYSDFLFKKTQFQDNIISIYVSFLNRYSQPEFSLSKNIEENIFTNTEILFNNDKYIYYPTINIEGEEFISPFLYKYNSILSLYEGFLTLKEQVFNLSTVTKIDQSYSQIEPIFKLLVSFNPVTMSTDFKIIPVIDDTEFVYKIVIPTLSVSETLTDTKLFSYPNILVDKNEVHVFVYNTSNIHLFDIKFINVGLIETLKGFLHLKKYFSQDKIFIIDVPLIIKENFLNDEQFYLTKLTSQLQSLSLQETRMITDDLQLKFINSYYVPQNINKKITIQELDFNLFLPLKLNIDLILEKKYIVVNSIDVPTAINKLRLSLATFLNSKNDSTIKLYSSQIVDYIYLNNPWIKFIDIRLLDNRDTEIPLSNIESTNQKIFISQINKEDILEYCPFLWWFDINNISITYKYLGD